MSMCGCLLKAFRITSISTTFLQNRNDLFTLSVVLVETLHKVEHKRIKSDAQGDPLACLHLTLSGVCRRGLRKVEEKEEITSFCEGSCQGFFSQ